MYNRKEREKISLKAVSHTVWVCWKTIIHEKTIKKLLTNKNHLNDSYNYSAFHIRDARSSFDWFTLPCYNLYGSQQQYHSTSCFTTFCKASSFVARHLTPFVNPAQKSFLRQFVHVFTACQHFHHLSRSIRSSLNANF